MKRIITTVALSLTMSSAFAQEKITIGILPINAEGENDKEAVAITEEVMAAFTKTKRFIVVDRTKMESIKQEKDMQKTEDFAGSSSVEQGKSLGAMFLVSNTLSSFSNDGEVCKFVLNLSIIEVATGAVLHAQTIDAKGGTHTGSFLKSAMSTVAETASSEGGEGGGGESEKKSGEGESEKKGGRPEHAFRKALKDIAPEIDKFVSKNFPVSFSIAEIQEKDDKGAAKTVLIAGGSAMGLNKGEKLKVVELVEMDVNGKKVMRKKQIGEMKIIKVEDENFSICTVSEGGADITTKFDAKAKLLAITEEKK